MANAALRPKSAQAATVRISTAELAADVSFDCRSAAERLANSPPPLCRMADLTDVPRCYVGLLEEMAGKFDDPFFIRARFQAFLNKVRSSPRFSVTPPPPQMASNVDEGVRLLKEALTDHYAAFKYVEALRTSAAPEDVSALVREAADLPQPQVEAALRERALRGVLVGAS
jgi:hypothetical protein